MKLTLSELNPNPYKKQINEGRLDDTQIQEIFGNLDELGFMGSIPVVKIKNRYHVVNSHHRVEALKRKFGDKYKVNVTVHKYNDDQLLRGMVIENLSQRSGKAQEEVENIRTVEEYLNANPKILISLRESRNQKLQMKGANARYEDGATAGDIKEWLKLSEKKWSHDRITHIQNLYKNLDPELLKRVEYIKGGVKEDEEHISFEDARNLSRIEDKEEQKQINDILKQSEMDNKEKAKAITVFKDLDEQDRKEVLSGNIRLEELEKAEIEPLTQGEMAIRFRKGANDLIIEMRRLRKTLNQFRREKIFDQFSPKQKDSFKDRLTTVKQEYKNLIDELDNSIKEL